MGPCSPPARSSGLSAPPSGAMPGEDSDVGWMGMVLAGREAGSCGGEGGGAQG